MTSNTARMGPPAMIPVPSWAGCISTRAAPQRPVTAWCSVPFFSFTLKSLRRASSIAFCTATGTSRALPLPMPMPPSPSPTTVSAAKPSTRPPFTTLVTRLTATIFSRRPSPRSSDCCILGWIFAIAASLELQSTAAGRLGERLDAPVIAIPGPVEGHAFDPGLLCLLGDSLADELGRLAVGAALQLPAHFLLQTRGGGDHLVAGRAGDLRVDMLVAPMHSEAHGSVLADADPGLPSAPGACYVLGVHGSPYFFFVSFSTMTSST